MQRNFEPMRKQVEAWQRSELTDVTAKVEIYEAFVEGRLEAPKQLARTVHDLYFEPRGVPIPDHMEPLQRVHVCVQGTGADRSSGPRPSLARFSNPDSKNRAPSRAFNRYVIDGSYM
ncbi:MAG TPA: hypothetical protein VMT53_22415 [Terriglobales bacterium]|nr:hypothetical protein [Terriglobales bacterium]